MTAPVPFQPQQAVHPPSSSSAKTNHSTSTLFQHQPGPAAGPNGHLPTADALFEALAMQNQAPLDAPVTDHPPVSTSAAGGSATSTGAPLSVHVQQLPTPRTSFSSGANSPPENMSPSQSQYTHAHQPHPQHIPHHLSTSQITPTSMISAASSSVSTPSTDYPSTLASPNNTNHSSINNTNINSSEFTNHGAASMTTATATASASWNLSSAMSTSSSVLSTPGTKAPPPSSHLYQPQSYPSLRSASPAMNSSISALGPSLYGSAPPSAAAAAAGVSGPGIGASSTSIGFNQYNGSAVYNNGKNIGGSFTAGTAAGLSQTVSSSYNNNITGSTSISFNAYDSSSDILYQQQQQEALYYDEKEQQKKNARSALSHVTSFLPPAVSHGLSKVVQQAHAAVGSTHGGRKMSLPTIAATAFGGSTTPSSTLGSSTMHVSSAASGVMIRKLYKASKLPLLCLAWYLSSAVTNNIGKQIMNQFRYPVTLTFIQFLFVSLFCFLSGTVGLTKIRTPTVGILQMTAPLVGFQVVGHVFSSVAIS
ncbi:suppressor of loss of ypt1, partial [Podila humilis]